MSKHTANEINARIAKVEHKDWMGTIRSDLIDYLPYEDAKQHLKPQVTKDQWDSREIPAPLDAARNYLEFAWGKANNCRGISAGRSLDHMNAWLWLAGFGDVVDEHFDDCQHYGKAQLVIASALCGFDWRAHDNGEWVSDEDGPSIPSSEIERIALESEQIARAALAKATGSQQ